MFSNNATVRAFTEDNPGDPPRTTLRRANGSVVPIPAFPVPSIIAFVAPAIAKLIAFPPEADASIVIG